MFDRRQSLLSTTAYKRHYVNLWPLIFHGLRYFAVLSRPKRSHFSHKSAFVQGVLERFWLLMKVCIVLIFPHGPHAVFPSPCTGSHAWSILHSPLRPFDELTLARGAVRTIAAQRLRRAAGRVLSGRPASVRFPALLDPRFVRRVKRCEMALI